MKKIKKVRMSIFITLFVLMSQSSFNEELIFFKEEFKRGKRENIRSINLPRISLLMKALDVYIKDSNNKWNEEDKIDVVYALLDIENFYGYSPYILLKLIKVESNFNINALSKDGAIGLCQIQPRTAHMIVKREIGYRIPEKFLYDPVINLKICASYLNYLEGSFKSLPKALVAYNMGPKKFEDIYGQGGFFSATYLKKIKH